MGKKISIRKIVVFSIYVIFILLIIIGIVRVFFMGKKTLDVQVIDTIDNYNYTLNNNATKYYKNNFEELSIILSNENIDENSYAKLVSKLFISDLYTLNNKLNKNDIGGTQFVYSDFVDDFSSYAKTTIYNNVENNMYNDRKQDLPIVTDIIINSVTNDSFKYGDKIFENSYYIDLEITYESDLGYPTNISLVLVENNNKIEVAKMETR